MFGISFDCFALGLRLALAVLVGGMLGLNRDFHRTSRADVGSAIWPAQWEIKP